MEATIQVRQRGTMPLPAELRKKYGIRAGDTFRLVDLVRTFVLFVFNLVPVEPHRVGL